MYQSEVLYKTSSTGAELMWRISTQQSNVKGWQVLTEHGQVDGAKQISCFDVLEGKNIGKANETTPEEQADSEARSKYNKQLDKGYSLERGGASKEYRPMLAHSYDDHKKKVTFPCYIQPKLDGMRCIAIREGDNITLMSRGNKQIDNMDHIKAELLKFMEDGQALDGELFNKDFTFQKTMSLIKRKQPGSELVEYHIYDSITSEDFKTRFLGNSWLINLPVMEDQFKSIKWVMTYNCESHEEITEKHNKFVNFGYEGAIVRHSGCKYKEGGRSNQLLKVKAFFDSEFEIVDVVPSDRSPTHGNFVCLIPGTTTTFTATPEGTHEMKEQYLRDRDSLIGKQLTVRYFEMTTSDVPVPRFPIGVAVRDYE